MRGRALLFIATICCIYTQATPHGHKETEEPDSIEVSTPSYDTETVPSNGTPAVSDPAIAYVPPKAEAHKTYDDGYNDMDMDMGMPGMEEEEQDEHEHHDAEPADGSIPPEEMSYWLWPEHRGLLYTHILVMIVAWGFVLPVGTHLLTHPMSNKRRYARCRAILLPYPRTINLPDPHRHRRDFRHNVQLSYPRLLRKQRSP